MDDVSIDRYVRLTKLAKALAQSEELAFGDALAVIHTVEQADAMEQALGSVDRSKREALAREANTLAMQDLALIPVHHQVVSWAMRANLAYVARTDEFTFAHHFTPR